MPLRSDLRGMRVLLVEDSWQVADALKLLLEKAGMIVSGPVASANEAQSLVAEHSPTLAVVDVNLKGEMAYALDGLATPAGHTGAGDFWLRGPTAIFGAVRGNSAQALHRDCPVGNVAADKQSTTGFLGRATRCASVPMHVAGSSILQRSPSASKARSTVPPSS